MLRPAPGRAVPRRLAAARYGARMRAVQIQHFGGPEVLHQVDLPDLEPAEGLLLVDVESAGVNYADTHQTENSYLAPQRLPLVPGAEVVGRVRDGELAGQRVVALLAGGGGYAEQALAHPSVTFPIADDLADAAALALVLQGTTAWFLLRSCTRLSPGESVVVHAGAGGVGHLAVQLARQWGAGRVIATASSEQKLALAAELGAHAGVDISALADADAVRAALIEANQGRELDVVLEMTGGHVFDGSLAALAPMGRIAAYGMASRTPPTPVQPAALMAGSRTVTGFWLMDALRRPDGLGPAMTELLSLARTGRLKPICGGRYPLADAAQAHRALLDRTSTGKLVLQVAQ
jgi:NADPH:quinone reductase